MALQFPRQKRQAPSAGSASGGEPAVPPVSPVASSDEIQAQLKKILASKGFAHSERLSRFLQFTVDQAVNGQAGKLKEYLIGVEAFDRDGSYDPRTDPIVRVEAGRLRARLKEYYATEGRDAPILIDFQKGGYVPIFKRRQPDLSLARRVRSSLRLMRDWKVALIVALAALAAIASYRAIVAFRQVAALQKQLEMAGRRAPGPEFAPVWAPFFSPGAETYVVFGSPMFFANAKDGVVLRNGLVNDPVNFLGDPNFRIMQERFGADIGPRYDYAEMGDAIALHKLTAFFGRAGRLLTALPAHQATWEAIKDSNIIFLGTPRMNPLLKNLPVRQDFEWGVDNSVYNRNPRPGEQKVYATTSHRELNTFVVISSFPGLRPGREMLLLSTYSSPGAMAVVDYLTSSDSVRAMTRKLGLAELNKPRHYEMLLRVITSKNLPVQTEYVTHHVVRE
jgi:hypothetical protein